MSVPKFSLDGSKHDMTTYWGRWSHFADLTDLRNALLSEAEVKDAQGLLASYKANTLPAGVTDAQLWDAKKKVQSAIHPDTNEAIPLAFRMSTFMPSNLPITAGMLLSGPGAAQVFWQWANQSYNAGFNYANRNATVPMDTAALALSYGVATGTACGMSFGLGRVVQRLQRSVGGASAELAPHQQPLGLRLLSRGLPWLAVATAGVANVLAMRYKEGLEGITVYDQAGAPMGTSVAAGRACLTQVALTRAALPVPILLIPPFVLDAVRSHTPLGPVMARSLPARFTVEMTVLAAFLQCALAPAVALFPPQGSMAAAEMEPQFRGRTSPSTGLPVTTYYYSKGV